MSDLTRLSSGPTPAPLMASAAMPAATPTAPKTTKQQQLRAELEATRLAFHALVQSHSGDRWRKSSGTTAWSCGEVLVHLTWSVAYLPQEVESARQGRGMFNAPSWLGWLANSLSFWYVRWMARSATPDALHRRYNRAIDATLRVLDTIRDDEWMQGANFYGEGFHSIERLFRTPTEHLNAHTQGWVGR